MRINFRRHQTFVPQQLLYGPQFRPIVQHGRCKSMPQHMWTSFLQRYNLREVPFHYSINRHRIHPVPVFQDKKRFRTVRYRFISYLNIYKQVFRQLVSKWYQPLLISLSCHFNQLGREVHIRIIQSYQFRKSHAGSIKHLQNHPVSNPFEAFFKRSFIKQPVHFLFSHKRRQRLFLFRPDHFQHRVNRHFFLP